MRFWFESKDKKLESEEIVRILATYLRPGQIVIDKEKKRICTLMSVLTRRLLPLSLKHETYDAAYHNASRYMMAFEKKQDFNREDLTNFITAVKNVLEDIKYDSK